jgi:hypothetical protein
MYSPLYFLAALGAGGLSVSFFLMLMFWIPHPGQPIPVFEDWVLAFQNGSLGTQIAIIVALTGVAFFVLTHVRLLVINYRLLGEFKKTSDYQEFARSPLQTQEMAAPLATAMTVNAGFIVGALFVPNLWSVVEYLFPLAMIAFLAIGVWSIRLYARLYSHAMSGHINIGGTPSFAQVLPAFTFAMVSVGLAAPAAMSHTPWVVGVSLVFSTFFAVAAIIIAVLKTAMALSHMLTQGVDEAALPTLWIWVPILTVLSITLMRQDHGVSHTLALGTADQWLTPLLIVVSAQVFVLLLGTFAMHNHQYLQKVWRGEVKGAPVFALICPGVALSVSLHFLINKGFVAAGLVSQFGIAYGILNLLPLTVMIVTIIVFMRLARNFAQERASLALHEHALGS